MFRSYMFHCTQLYIEYSSLCTALVDRPNHNQIVDQMDDNESQSTGSPSQFPSFKKSDYKRNELNKNFL